MVVMWVFILCSVFGLFKHFEGLRVTKFGSGCCGGWEEKKYELYRMVSRNFGQSESWKGEERIGKN
jgi:hypothetical protein